ncbi:MAG: hypothetical protein Q9208_004511 [Pyrenodesmia sp. 3 TL-2023]
MELAPPPPPHVSPPDLHRPKNDPALFLNHRFFDFRPLANESFASNLTPPALIDNSQDDSFEPLTSPFFGRGLFGDYFAPASWNKSASPGSPIRMHNSQQNIYLSEWLPLWLIPPLGAARLTVSFAVARDTSDSPVHLTLRTNRLTSFQSTSNLETLETDFLHASIRVRARVAGPPGACAGIFTYYSDDQESDIEILTRDDRSIMRATNQPGVDPQGTVIPEASTQVVIPGRGSEANGSWTDWNEYQLDWLPGRSEWFINGVSKLNKTYGVPTEASNFQIRMWSDGGAWTGNMSVGGMATLDLEWIDIVYNTTRDAPGGSCTKVCTVENIANDPVPQVAGANIGAARIGVVSASVLGALWAGFFLFLSF